jgi:hypothetical protein
MEGKRIFLGDHTGLVKLLSPEVSIFGSAGKGLGIINLVHNSSGLLVFRESGKADRLSVAEGSFEELRPGHSKIVEGLEFADELLLVYPDGTFALGDQRTQTSISACTGAFAFENTAAFCGNANCELWDLEQRTVKWTAWTTLPKETVNDTKCRVVRDIVYTVTENNELRLFDIRAGKKPRKNIQINKKGTTHCCALSALWVGENQGVFVGDAIGSVYSFDNQMRVLAKSKGRGVGAVTSIDVDDNNVYSCGLDRALMVYDREHMRIKLKKYLWQKLNKVVVVSD